MDFINYKCLESLLIEDKNSIVTEGLFDKFKLRKPPVQNTKLDNSLVNTIKDAIYRADNRDFDIPKINMDDTQLITKYLVDNDLIVKSKFEEDVNGGFLVYCHTIIEGDKFSNTLNHRSKKYNYKYGDTVLRHPNGLTTKYLNIIDPKSNRVVAIILAYEDRIDTIPTLTMADWIHNVSK